MNDTKWDIDQRINKAYQFAENRRLAREVMQARPVNPPRLFIRAFLKSAPKIRYVEAAATLSLVPEK